MANTERFSVSVDKDRASRIRALVDSGAYPSVSSAFDAAADALIEREAAKEEWWAETIRRCDEAEKHPEKLLDAATFHKLLWDDIADMKKKLKDSQL
jgi:Arc/MetJ-type ribon-helix-helix transcriptional regulator